MARKLKSGYYWRGQHIWVYRDPITGRRESTGLTDPQAAYTWRRERERLAASPGYVASTRATVGDWARKILARKKADRAAGTLHMYTVKLGHVTRIFGAASPLSVITAAAVDRYIDQRRHESAKSNTIQRELSCLRQLLRHARRAGDYSREPSEVMPIGFSAEYVPVTRTLRPEDLPKLMGALRDDTQRAWVALALTFAADAADIHRMRPEDYDPSTNLFHVRGTKNRARDARLPVLEMMRPLFEMAYPMLPLAWPRNSNGVSEACERAGIPHLSPKDLRRTAITWLAEGGVEQSLTSRFARHIGDQMVRKVYAQVSAGALGRLIESQITQAVAQYTHRGLGSQGVGNESSVNMGGPSRTRTGTPKGQGILKTIGPDPQATETTKFHCVSGVGSDGKLHEPSRRNGLYSTIYAHSDPADARYWRRFALVQAAERLGLAVGA